MNTKTLLSYGLRIPLNGLFYVVSSLTNLSRGSKYLVSLKITLGTLLIMVTAPMYSQKKEPLKLIKNSSDDTLNLNVTLEEDIHVLDDIVVTCYYGTLKKPSVIDAYEKRIHDYIKLNLIYPPKAIRRKIEGNVRVEYFIDQNGDAIEPAVIKGIGYGCDEEAFRLVKSLHKYDPAMDGRKALPYKLIITIEFKLPKKN